MSGFISNILRQLKVKDYTFISTEKRRHRIYLSPRNFPAGSIWMLFNRGPRPILSSGYNLRWSWLLSAFRLLKRINPVIIMLMAPSIWCRTRRPIIGIIDIRKKATKLHGKYTAPTYSWGPDAQPSGTIPINMVPIISAILNPISALEAKWEVAVLATSQIHRLCLKFAPCNSAWKC